jgi:hypothetical protein
LRELRKRTPDRIRSRIGVRHVPAVVSGFALCQVSTVAGIELQRLCSEVSRHLLAVAYNESTKTKENLCPHPVVDPKFAAAARAQKKSQSYASVLALLLHPLIKNVSPPNSIALG